MKELQEKVEQLIAEHGDDAIVKAVQILTKRAARPIPAEFIPVLDPLRVQETLSQLDASSSEVLNAIKGSEEEFEKRKQLLSERETVQSEIELAEAEAIMQIRGGKGDQFVLIGEEKVALTNDQARDAYRKTSSKDLRKRLAEINAELVAIDANAQREKDYWNDRKAVYDNIRRKADLQAALLLFLK